MSQGLVRIPLLEVHFGAVQLGGSDLGLRDAQFVGFRLGLHDASPVGLLRV